MKIEIFYFKFRIFFKFCLLISLSSSFHAEGGILTEKLGFSSSTLTAPHPLNDNEKKSILNDFLHPSPIKRHWKDFSLVKFLKHHFRDNPHLGSLASDLDGILGIYMKKVYDAGYLRLNTEKNQSRASLQTDSQASFYFYLALLAMVRDVDFNTLSEDFPEYNWGNIFLSWSWAQQNSHQRFKLEKLGEKGIFPDLIEHRSDYLELLAYRFLVKNQNLKEWGKSFCDGRRTHLLGNYTDKWETIKPELEAFRALSLDGSFKDAALYLTQYKIDSIYLEAPEDNSNSLSTPLLSTTAKDFTTESSMVSGFTTGSASGSKHLRKRQ